MTIKKIRGKKFLLQEMVGGGGGGWRSNSCLKNAPFHKFVSVLVKTRRNENKDQNMGILQLQRLCKIS